MFDGQLIGVDVGGTKVAVATLEGGRLSDSMVRPTDMTSADGLINEIVAGVGALRSDRTAAVGVGMPSVVEFATGRARTSVNLGLAETEIRSGLTEVARRFVLPGVGERTEIRLARYGSRAGVRGAALLAGLELSEEERDSTQAPQELETA